MDNILLERGRTSPEVTALVDAETGQEWTYAELDTAVDSTAGRLSEFGEAADDRVGVLMETRPAFVRLVFAVLRLGGVVVPLNARLSAPELADQFDAAELSCVVCDAETEATALQAAGECPVVSVDEPTDERVITLGAEPEANVSPGSRALGDPVVVMFTSGTTGDPKAVQLTPRNFGTAAVASVFRLGLDSDERWCCPLSLYHMGGLSVVVRSVLYGTTAIITRGFDTDATLDVLSEYDCTGVSVVPTMLKRLLEAGDLPDSLRFVLVGGAPTPPALAETCADRDVPIYPSYGMTETTSQIATAHPREAFDDPDTVGRALLPTEVTIVDDHGDPLPSGEVGEVVVAGPTVTPGYDDSKQTADAFGPYGFHTGDVGYLDGSRRLHVLDRQSDRIVTGGENVHPGEVVDVLRRHPDVDDAAVVGIDDPEWGERVAALVVADEDNVSADALRDHCQQTLANYKCPRTIAFADALPRTASGTVDRSAARERIAAEADT